MGEGGVGEVGEIGERAVAQVSHGGLRFGQRRGDEGRVWTGRGVVARRRDSRVPGKRAGARVAREGAAIGRRRAHGGAVGGIWRRVRRRYVPDIVRRQGKARCWTGDARCCRRKSMCKDARPA